ncbi:MAG: hypothetical protein FJ271_30680 [Planctomycetes bacterium]|nr:hypothetical protein [Planctomycetota bacterium]
MSAATTCYHDRVLNQFLTGALSDADAAALEAHLLSCNRCAETINNLFGMDTLAQSMKNQPAHAADAPDAESVRQLLARLRQQLSGRTADTHATTQDHTGGDGSADPASVDPLTFLAPPQAAGELGRLAHYRILEVLGAGGMGIVFRAEDTQLDRPVALKVMKPVAAARPGAQERFLREARTAAAIEHDHIITIHQAGRNRQILPQLSPRA